MGKYGCYFMAFLIYFISILTIYTMVYVSFLRCMVVHDPIRMRKINLKTCFYILLTSAFISIFMSTMPLFGVSTYTLEGAYLSCSIDWNLRSSLSSLIYNLSGFLIVYFFPMLALIVTNFRLIYAVIINFRF